MYLKSSERKITMSEAIKKFQDGFPIYRLKGELLEEASTVEEIQKHSDELYVKEKVQYGLYELTLDEIYKIREIGINLYDRNTPLPLELYVRDFMQDQLGMSCAMDSLSEEETDEVVGKIHKLSAQFLKRVDEDEITQYLNDRIIEFLMKKMLL